MRRVSLVVLMLALFGAGCAADKPNTNANPKPTKVGPDLLSAGRDGDGPAGVGTTITLQGRLPGEQLDVTLARLVDPAPGDEFSPPRGGRKFTAVQIRLVNTGSIVYSDAPAESAKLIDEGHQQYQTTEVALATGPGFAGKTVTLAPGETRLGYLAFDVPAAAVAMKFQFALDAGSAEQTGQWALS